MVKTKSKAICIPQEARKQTKTKLQEFMKRFTKEQFADLTIRKAANWLSSQYNINNEQAMAYIASVMQKAMVNPNGKYSGHQWEYQKKVWESILSNYGHLVDSEWKTYLTEGRYPKEVEKISSPSTRAKLLAAEMMAYLHWKHKPPSTSYTQLLTDLEWKWLGKPVMTMWSKPAFWLAVNLLVFDVLSAGAEGVPQYNVDEETIRHNYPRWYETREYANPQERFLWKVYDEVVEEIGRDMAAAAIAEGGVILSSRAFRLLARVVLDLASFHPALRGLRVVGTVAKAISEYLGSSFLVFLASQVAIEWPLEGWFALHEWNFLRDARDLLEGYAPFPWGYGFSPDSWDEYKDIAIRLLNNDYVSAGELKKYELYTEMAKEKGMNFAKLIDEILKLREWLHTIKNMYKDTAENILKRELPPDLRPTEPKQWRPERNVKELMNDQYLELLESDYTEHQYVECPELYRNTRPDPLEHTPPPPGAEGGEICGTQSFPSSEIIKFYGNKTAVEIEKDPVTLDIHKVETKCLKVKKYSSKVGSEKYWTVRYSGERSRTYRAVTGSSVELIEILGYNFYIDDPDNIIIPKTTGSFKTAIKQVPVLRDKGFHQIPCFASIQKGYEIIKGNWSYSVNYSSKYEIKPWPCQPGYCQFSMALDNFIYLGNCRDIQEYWPLVNDIVNNPTRIDWAKDTEYITITIERIFPFIPRILLVPSYYPVHRTEDVKPFLESRQSSRCVSFKKTRWQKKKGKKIDVPLSIGKRAVVYTMDFKNKYIYSFSQTIAGRIDMDYEWIPPETMASGSGKMNETTYAIDDLNIYKGGLKDGIPYLKIFQQKRIYSDYGLEYLYSPYIDKQKNVQFNSFLKTGVSGQIIMLTDYIKFASDRVVDTMVELDPINPGECIPARIRRAKVICGV